MEVQHQQEESEKRANFYMKVIYRCRKWLTIFLSKCKDQPSIRFQVSETEQKLTLKTSKRSWDMPIGEVQEKKKKLPLVEDSMIPYLLEFI